jgi:hypothetical protein
MHLPVFTNTFAGGKPRSAAVANIKEADTRYRPRSLDGNCAALYDCGTSVFPTVVEGTYMRALTLFILLQRTLVSERPRTGRIVLLKSDFPISTNAK